MLNMPSYHNLFIRYFAHETVAQNIDEVISFLLSIGEFPVDNTVGPRIQNYWNSDNVHPFRLKVNYSNYVLFLKTTATSTEQFHEFEQQREGNPDQKVFQSAIDRKRQIMEALNEVSPGWYEATLLFKRVLVDPYTMKCSYIDTPFTVRCKAESPIDCYTRMTDYIDSRSDIDKRSQIPSAKSSSFTYRKLQD